MAAEKLIVATLDPVEVGQRFKKLPIHVTLMPWLNIDPRNEAEFDRYMNVIARKLYNIYVIGKDEAMFGPEYDTKVRLVAEGALRAVHFDILAAADWAEATYDESYVGENYIPHVSYTQEKRLAEDEIASVTAMQVTNRGRRQSKKKRGGEVYDFGEPLDTDNITKLY